VKVIESEDLHAHIAAGEARLGDVVLQALEGGRAHVLDRVELGEGLEPRVVA
jgi:hypothetical protein